MQIVLSAAFSEQPVAAPNYSQKSTVLMVAARARRDRAPASPNVRAHIEYGFLIILSIVFSCKNDKCALNYFDPIS